MEKLQRALASFPCSDHHQCHIMFRCRPLLQGAFFIFGEIAVLLRNRALLAVSFAVCATFTGIGMVAPVRVLYAQAHGASFFIIGAMGSSYLISNFLFQYPSG